jgi:hypothetical protein
MLRHGIHRRTGNDFQLPVYRLQHEVAVGDAEGQERGGSGVKRSWCCLLRR